MLLIFLDPGMRRDDKNRINQGFLSLLSSNSSAANGRKSPRIFRKNIILGVALRAFAALCG
jgi:hypothetical protein